LGIVYAENNNFVKAEECFNAAFSCLPEFDVPCSEEIKSAILQQKIAVTQNFGELYRYWKKLEKAKEKLLNALKLVEIGYGNRIDASQISVRYELCLVYQLEKKYSSIVNTLKSILPMIRPLYGDNPHRILLGVYQLLGIAYTELNDFENAKFFCDKRKELMIKLEQDALVTGGAK